MALVAWGDITRGMDKGKLSQEEISVRQFSRTKARRRKRISERRWTYQEVTEYLRSLRGDLRETDPSQER